MRPGFSSLCQAPDKEFAVLEVFYLRLPVRFLWKPRTSACVRAHYPCRTRIGRVPGIYCIFLYNILLRKAVPLFIQSFLRTSVGSTYIVWQMPANRRATSIPFYGNFNGRTIPAYRTFPSIYVTPQVSGHSLPWSISPVFFLPWVSPSSDTHPEQNLWLFQNMYLCSS